jgi:hypothetical protein
MAEFRYLLTYKGNSGATYTDRTVHPIANGVSIEYEEDKDYYFFRKTLKGEFVFYNDAKNGFSDFDEITHITDRCTVFSIRIEKQWGSTWVNWYEGSFTIYNGKVDEDACTFTVTPSVLDDYNCIEKIYEKEYNICGLPNPIEVVLEKSDATSAADYPVIFFEYFDDITWDYYIPEATLYGDVWSFPFDEHYKPLKYEAIIEGTMYQYGTLPPSVPSHCWELYSIYYVCTDPVNKLFTITMRYFTVYFLQYKISDSCSIADIAGGLDDTWFTFVGTEEIGNLQFCKYRIHPYYVNNEMNYIYNSVEQSFVYDNSVLYANRSFYSGRLLTDVIDALIADCGLVYESNFFNDSINPITNYYSQLNNLVIVPNSEVCNWQLSNRAGRELLTLKDLLNDLKVMFNIGYTVENGVFRIEHRYYFENGGSYSANRSLGTNLTTLINPTTKTTYIEAMNKYSFNTDKLVSKEHFSHYTGEMNLQSDAVSTTMVLSICNVDFAQMKIEYIDCNESGEETKYQTNKLSADWIKLMFNYDPNLRGFCLFTTIAGVIDTSGAKKPKPAPPPIPNPTCPIHGGRIQQTPGAYYIWTPNHGWRIQQTPSAYIWTPNHGWKIQLLPGEEYYYTIANETTELTQTSIPNGHLSWGNLHKNYWMHGRILPKGYMVGKPTTFTSSLKLKKQTELTFHNCNTVFDPYKLIRTEMGDGEVESATEELENEVIKVILRYD